MGTIDLINEGRINKLFQVRNKLIYSGGFYHVTQRATGGEPLFVEDSDYLYMLHLIKEKTKKFNLQTFAFCLMSNHLHLLLKIIETNLSVAMKNLFETYADFFNDKYKRVGTLYCGRYRIAHCLNERYFLASSLYIHLNPVRAGLIKSPEDYRWSSCKLYTTLDDKKTFLDYKFILRILDSDLTKAKKKYKVLLDQGERIETKGVLKQSTDLKYFWRGSFKFLSQILEKHQKREDLLKNGEVIIEELIKKRRLRMPQEVKAKRFLIQQLISMGYSISEVAERINQTRQSVYKVLKSKT